MAQMDHNEAIQLQVAVKYVLGELSPVQREETASSLAKDSVAARGGWLGWFQPVAAVPAFAFAALLLIIAYQNTVTIPHAREEASSGAAQLFVTSHAPKMAVTRGGEEVKLSVHPNESLALKFDFTPSQTFDAYVCQLQDEAGRSLLQLRVPGSFTNKELNLVVPAGRVEPGKYTLVFTGDAGSKGQATKDEVLRFSFAIEFLH